MTEPVWIEEQDALALHDCLLALHGGPAGVRDAEQRRVHDLRHTHAHLLLESNHNLATIQARLHHSSLATTGLYVKAIGREDPVDTFSAQFQQLRLSV